MIIIVISILVFFISYRLFRIAAGSLSIYKLNTISYLFYYSIVISTFIGAVYVALGYGADHWILCHASDRSRIIAWISVCYSLIAMPIGMIILNNLLHISPKRSFNNYINSKIDISYEYENISRVKRITMLMSIFSVLVFIYIFKNSGSWPLYTAVIEKDILASQEGRIDVRLNFGGIIYIKNLFGLMLVPAFSYYSYIVYFIYRNKILFFNFIITLICSFLILTYDTQKAPIVFYFVGYLILRVLLYGSIPKSLIIICGTLALVLISFMYFLFSGGSSNVFDILLDPNSALYGRMFVSGFAGVPLSFEWFPDVIKQPTWQIGIPGFILDAHNLPKTESARLLMLRLNPEGNLVSSYYIAEAWANYGIVGVILSPFIVGLNVQAVHLFLLKHSKQPLIMAFYALVTTKWVVSSGFVNFLLFKSIIFPYILYAVVSFLIKHIKFKRCFHG